VSQQSEMLDGEGWKGVEARGGGGDHTVVRA
jgi:hypothetical protein